MMRHAAAALGAFLVIGIGSSAAAQVDVNVDYRNTGGGGGAKATTANPGSAAKPGTPGEDKGGYSNESIESIRKVDLSDPNEDFYGLNLPQQALYTGIIPNVRDSLPHLRNNPLLWQNTRRNRFRRNRLTWVGFQRQPQFTRVFIQTGRPTTYSVSRSVDGVSLYITLDDTINTVSNFRRNVDTRWYPRSISGIRARRVRGRKVRIEIDTRIAAEYNISSEGNYIYVDFKDASLEQQIAPTEAPDKPEDDDGVLGDPDPLGD